MKLRVERDALTDAVTWASRTLPARPTVPLLAGIRLEASAEGHATLSAFDHEVSAELQCPAEVADAGLVLINGKLLAEICRALPDRPVDMFVDESRVSVTCGQSRFTLPAMPVEEYPKLPQLPPVAGMVSAEEFVTAVGQVATAASKDDTLPMLTGVRMEFEGDVLTMISTDRYRLALREMPWRAASPSEGKVALLRAKTLSEAAKAQGADNGDITIALTDDEEQSGRIGFATSGRTTTSLLLDGEYPKVRALFPPNPPIYAVVHKAELMGAVKRVALVAERNTPVRLTFTDGSVTLEAGQGDDAQASELVEGQLTGEEIVTAFNPQYFLEGLNAIPQEYVRISFTEAPKPAVLTGQTETTGPDDTSFRYLLMPIRLNG